MRISDWSSDVCSSDLGADLFGVGTGHANARKFLLPLRLRLGLRRVEAVAADFGAQVQQRLFGADEGGGDADVDLVVLLGLEAEHRADTIGRASCRERVCQYV